MNTKQLEYFVSLSETLNFTKTAQKFFISQTAVTKQIKKLEQILNTKLFNRNNHYVELTPSGRMFLPQAKTILRQIEVASERVQLTTAGFFGLLNIGFVKGYEKTSFSDLVFHFHNEYPNISINLVRATEKELYEKISSSELDIAFNVWNDKEINDRIEGHLIESFSFHVVVHPTHPLATKKSLSMKELSGETIFQHNEYADVESILLMVSANMGIAILPFYCIRYLNQSQNLIIIPLKDKNKYVNIAAIWNKDNPNPALPKLTHIIKNEEKNT